jgi:hypothetical protein
MIDRPYSAFSLTVLLRHLFSNNKKDATRGAFGGTTDRTEEDKSGTILAA